MKTRKWMVPFFIIAAVVLLGAVQGIIPLGEDQSRQQNIEKAEKPSAYDFEAISKYKSKYMGDASNLSNLFRSLPLNDVEMTFQLYPETFTADVNYKKTAAEIGMDKVQKAIIYNATAAFTMIDNLEAVNFNFTDAAYKVLRSEVLDWYGINLKTLAEKSVWDKEVQSKLKDDIYVQSCAKAIIKKEEKRTQLEDAIMTYYQNTNEPVVIYEQLPFEEGTLVLAEKLSDGEHYPDLHFIDAYNRVTHLTRGSYCWTLNYTQFKDCYIYFGLAGVETRQYNNPIRVEKVEAKFADKTEEVILEEKLIAHINPMEGDSRLFKNPQGYIMPVKGREIPYSVTALLQNGEKLSLSDRVIKSSLDNMPDYLKSENPEVYNSYAFTFTPMLTPSEWEKGYKDGEICLEGRTDGNGNRNVLNLRPAGNISLVQSFVVPQDIKPLYLSDNYARSASFEPGENVQAKYPGNRKLMSCSVLRVTREKAEKEIGQDRFAELDVDVDGKFVLPKEKGYYLFLMRTMEDKAMELQTYTGMLLIK